MVLDQLPELFPFEVLALDMGLKYLGYYLKPNNYLLEGWTWILKKVENIIGNWCNRWLSLGGTLILVKVVLENLPIYWLSIAKIPKLVLERIIKLMFSFLWMDNRKKEGVHLMNQERLYLPKSVGGWGIKNIFHFEKALAAKSLWRGLFKKGIWKDVIITI